MSGVDSDGLKDFLPDDFTMYPSSCLDSIPRKPGIYILIQILSQHARSHKYQYIGHGGDLKERLKQHLCEDSGTFTGEKKAVVLNPGKLTDVGYFEIPDDIEWPSDVDKPQRKEGVSQKKYKKKYEKIMAEALEELAKNHPIYSPVLNDKLNASNKALELLQNKKFRERLERVLQGELNKIPLPSAKGLYEENTELKNRINDLEDELERQVKEEE